MGASSVFGIDIHIQNLNLLSLAVLENLVLITERHSAAQKLEP